MSVNENGNLRPDGVSVTLPFLGLGGTYYWNPGAPTSPNVTLTGGLGMGGGGVHAVFLRKGMTSQDSLGYGATANIAPTIVPSVTVNGSIPDENGIPQPWNAKVSSIDAGIGLPGFGVGYTTTPNQISEFINKYVLSPAMGPYDELSPFERNLQSGLARIGSPSVSPIRFIGSSPSNPLGDGMENWSAANLEQNEARGNFGVSTPQPMPFSRASAVPYVQETRGGLPGLIASAGGGDASDPMQFQSPAGGLLGLIQDYMRSHSAESGRY
jgi:hypothetical protein